MSHFTVLVAANNEQELEARLLPYHEYECTGFKEYTEFVPTNLEEAAERMKENNERWAGSKHPEYVHESLENFIPEYYGAEKNEQGVWGCITNQRSHWDWWVIGGRWSGLLMLKPDNYGKGIDGEGGVMNAPNRNPALTDSALIGQIDWNGMLVEEIQQKTERYQKWKILSDEDKKNPKILYNTGFFMLEISEADDLNNLTEDAYVTKYARKKAMTFAFVDTVGEWHERATMGWWASTSNQQPEYDLEWWNFIRSLPDNQRVWVIDAHI